MTKVLASIPATVNPTFLLDKCGETQSRPVVSSNEVNVLRYCT